MVSKPYYLTYAALKKENEDVRRRLQKVERKNTELRVRCEVNRIRKNKEEEERVQFNHSRMPAMN